MVTLESNRVQPSTAGPFDRPAQASQPPAEPAAQGPRPEPQAPVPLRDPFWLMSLVVAGATMGSMWALSAAVLAVLGLSGVAPAYILPATGIVLGLALVTLGGIGAAWARMFRFAERAAARDRMVLLSGVNAAYIAGLAAVVLGILNFAFLGSARFAAGTVVVLGVGLFWQGGVMRRVSRFTHDVAFRGAEGKRPSGLFAVNALSLAPLRDFLVGTVAAILGILAMSGIAPVVLAFVALLVMGAALTFTASTICGASLAALEHAGAKG